MALSVYEILECVRINIANAKRLINVESVSAGIFLDLANDQLNDAMKALKEGYGVYELYTPESSQKEEIPT